MSRAAKSAVPKINREQKLLSKENMEYPEGTSRK